MFQGPTYLRKVLIFLGPTALGFPGENLVRGFGKKCGFYDFFNSYPVKN